MITFDARIKIHLYNSSLNPQYITVYDSEDKFETFTIIELDVSTTDLSRNIFSPQNVFTEASSSEQWDIIIDAFERDPGSKGFARDNNFAHKVLDIIKRKYGANVPDNRAVVVELLFDDQDWTGGKYAHFATLLEPSYTLANAEDYHFQPDPVLVPDWSGIKQQNLIGGLLPFGQFAGYYYDMYSCILPTLEDSETDIWYFGNFYVYKDAAQNPHRVLETYFTGYTATSESTWGEQQPENAEKMLLSLINETSHDPDIINDPYENIPDSTPEGGGGDGDYSGDIIEQDPLPTFGAGDTGFITIYHPTIGELNQLASYMWSSSIETVISKLFSNPMDAMIGLLAVPVVPEDGALRIVKVGNVSTSVEMREVANQFVDYSLGSISVNSPTQGFLDYSPYTMASLYLPYVGDLSIDIDKINGKTMYIDYRIDLMTGGCIATVKVDNMIILQGQGNCGANIPLSGADYGTVVQGVISIAASLASMVASHGATAPIAVPSMASTAAQNLKPDILHGGSISSSIGFLGKQSAILTLKRPELVKPANFGSLKGYPLYTGGQLSDYQGQGFTVIEEVHLDQIQCLDQERQEIESVLKRGVIL